MWQLRIFILLMLLILSCAFECGKSKTAIGFNIGGEYSEPGQWPWLASIYYKEKFWAGASLISDQYLLGAAHTAHGKSIEEPYPIEEFHAFLGGYDLNERNPHSVRVEFWDITIHPDWDPYKESFDADIALFWMTYKVQFSSYIQPVCLPTEDAKIFDVEGTVVGYGVSETSSVHEYRPKHVKIKSVEHGVCIFHDKDFASLSSPRMFCGGERGKNPCRGDSGGPFMVKENNHWTVIGIVSSSTKEECKENDFALFTQVPKFLGWTKEIVEGGRQLECSITIDPLNDTVCSTDSLIIHKPNLRVTSIRIIGEPLDFNDIFNIFVVFAQVYYFPDFSFANKKFPNFKGLLIHSSGLKEIDRSKLALLPQLTYLVVSDNKIQELPENVFDDLINLKVLSIDGNQVKIVAQKLLWKLPKLERFFAKGNQIEAIPARFFEMNKNIEIIEMSDNKISRIEIDLRSLPKLEEFNFSGNQCIDKNFIINDYSKNELEQLLNKKCREA